MKKKSFIYGMMLLGAVSFTGCTDMLEKEPLDSFTNNPLFWNNPASVEGYAAKFYNLYTGYGNNGGTGDFYFRFLSDDQVGASYAEWKYTNIPTGDANWAETWDWIRHANVMIQELEGSATDMDQLTKNHYLGVARLMRAWQYWDLVRKFGDCPWVDHAPDVTDPVLFAAREDRDKIMDYVYSDLEFACRNIEDTGSKTTWSRNLAYAMTSQICLWEGTFRKYRTQDENGKGPDEAGSKKFLEMCVWAGDQLMPKFSICDEYQSIYNSVSEELAANPEIIFYKEYKKDVFMHSLIDYCCTTTQMSGMSKDAFDSYLFRDGKTAAQTTLDNTDAGVMAKSDNDGLNHVNIRALLDVRDKRLGVTIDTVLCYPGNPWPRVAGGMLMTSSTGYGVAKFDDVEMELDYRQNTVKNYTSAPLYWMAVIYLDYAEAKAELGTITEDDLRKTVNQLRHRAGLPDLTLNPADLGDNDSHLFGNKKGVSSLIWEIRRERRCELMFDNDFRYWDLIRWHELDRLDSEKNPSITLGANLSNANDFDPDKVTLNGDGYVNGYIIDGKPFKRVFEKKHYLYPIPTGQILLNDKLEQNPNWKNN